mmetsp:Transcript_43064/g.71779  ORF Transcript_43064/g.71779 Transcript_43064/m.71779 type:complete len:257 (+) Transcript_43064:676-1446(+)
MSLNNLFKAASPSNFSSFSSAFSSDSSLSQSFGFLDVLDVGYAGLTVFSGLEKLSGCGTAGLPVPSRFVHCTRAFFCSVISTLEVSTANLHCSGTRSANRLRSSRYTFPRSSGGPITTNSVAGPNSTCTCSAGTFFANTETHTLSCVWYHSCRYCGGVYDGAEASAGAVSAAGGALARATAAGVTTEGCATDPEFVLGGCEASSSSASSSSAISTSHLRIAVKNDLLVGSSLLPCSKACFAVSYSSKEKQATPLRR